MSTLDETVLKLKTEIATHVSKMKATESWTEVEKLFTALNTIEGLNETPKTSLAELFGFSSEGEAVSVRAGEFIGMDPVEAAKKYLEKKKTTASSLDEIMDALDKGGAERATRESLATSLARSTWDVVKAPGQELYTLVKYTPHVSRGRRKKTFVDPPDAQPSTDGNEEAKQ
jgi:hypothetical protein